jgi:tRNA-intron endonuclease
MAIIRANLVSEKISSNSLEAYGLFEKERFGERVGEKIVYSLVESLFLIEASRMKIFDSREKEIKTRDLLKRFERMDREFMTKYSVFKDLRKKGYVVKSALKFGAEFRVYEPGSAIGEAHAKWILFPLSEHKKITMQEFCAKNRVANSTNKKLMMAIVDDEQDVSYYEARWLKI